ncbi:hypothetical protein Slin14017_G043140 [Septoria linicola]|nr:hypothetical protein Slin14017_G043140 [Septoria linicola]
MVIISACVVLLLAVSIQPTLGETCYYPDGTASPNTNLTICKLDAKFSACCGSGDMCTTNGFCKAPSDRNNNFYWRDHCTDPTFNAPNCPKRCTTYATNGTALPENSMVLACSATTYCCAPWRGASGTKGKASNYTCCSDPLAVFDAGLANYLAGANFPTAAFPATFTVTATAAAETASSTATGSSSTSSGGGLGTGAKAGIGIGVAVVALAAIALIAWVLLRRRRRTRNQQSADMAVAGSKEPMLASNDDERNEKAKWEKPRQEEAAWQKPAQLAEADSQWREPVEMPANGQDERRELPG